MQRYIFKVTLIILVVIICFNKTIKAQIGSDCDTPFVVTAIPFVASGLSTATTGNHYTTSPCSIDYISGNDFVFTYTPAITKKIRITLTNTGPGVGVFVVNGCGTGATCIAKDEAQGGNPKIDTVTLFAGNTYYIIVSTYNLFGFNPTTNFNISIEPVYNIDAGVILIDNRSTCFLNNNVILTIRVNNWGSDTIFPFPIAYKINSGNEVVDTFPHLLSPGQSTLNYHSFINFPADLSIPGTTYKIQAYPKVIGEQNYNNDTLTRYITNFINVSSFPYFENFENGNGNWVTEISSSSYSPSSWQLGNPNKPIINSAASGTNSWVTSLTGNCNPNEESFIYSPCFDLANLTLPIFEFKIWYEMGNYDYTVLEYCTDTGYASPTNAVGWHWIRVGNTNEGMNWYNTPSSASNQGWTGSSGGWLLAKHTLDSVIGKSHVQFRIKFINGANTTSEGFAFDDVKIYDSPNNDIGILNIIKPISECGIPNIDSVTVKIKNCGQFPQSNFKVGYSINNGASYIIDTITSTLNFEDTLIYTFHTPLNLTSFGEYLLIAKAFLINDQDSLNDTANTTFVRYNNISALPINENFEQDNGGWYSSGINSSWQYGVPSDTVITHAASGTHCWVTNLTGYHNQPEQSYITSPCFDLTNTTKPVIKFSLWYETLNPSGAQLELSTNNGNTWQVLGLSTDTNWYNQGYMWIGHSGGWKQVEHKIYNYSGNPSIQFRIKFQGYIAKSGIGFDDFIICDSPVASFTTVANGRQITFTNTSVFPDSSFWDFGNGDSSTLSNPVHTFTNVDSADVRLIVKNDCGVDTTYQKLYFSGIENISETNIIISPNPAKRILNIKFDKNYKDLTVEVYNALGNKVYSEYYNNVSPNFYKQISLIDYNEGVYIIKLKTNKGIFTKKLVIKK